MSNHLSPSGQSDHYSVGSGASPASSQRSTNAGTMSTSASSIHSDTEADSPANGPKPTPCQWEGCQLTYDDPEELYRHLCDDHVGRKSTNNLCLTCRWIGCDVTCAKRDHITSHLRVHTPLKPHSCDTCGKTFKRPQDLKKHERIHTEAHQLAQQQRAKGIMPGMPGSAYGPNMHDAGAYTAFNLAASHGAVPGMNISHVQQPPYGYAYPAAAQHQQSPRFGLPPPPTATSAYPALPGAVPAAVPAGYPSMYGPGSHAPQHHREQTPQWSGAASNASVSPMSSHLGTPGPRSGNYHAAPPSQYVSSFTPLQQTHAAEMKPGSYIHYAAGERPKPADDMSSYLGLARGASYSTAGHKRSWDESVEATRGFVNDVQSKQMRPTYDQGMAQRLEHTFAGGIDEASLSALLQNIDPASMHSSHVDGPALSSLLAGQAPSFNASSKKTDLAELNAFLLQLGAHAAKDLIANNAAATQHASAPPMHHHHHQQSHSAGSSSSSAPSQEMHNPFDVNNLQAYGLADIPGFDESLFEYESVAPQQQQHASSQWAGQRPIAQLPARSSYANEVSASLYTNAAPYRHAHGHALVPQLAAKDGSSANYRRVEALTRAAPVETASGVHDVHLRDSKDTSRDMDVDEAPSHDRASSNRSASPAASEATSEASTVSIHRPSSSSSSAQRHGLYPRLSPVDGARTSSNAPASPTSPYSNAPFRPRPMPYDRQARSQRSTTSDAGSPSPPPSVSSEPRRTPQRSSTVDAVADDVAALNGLGASPTEEGVPLAVRAQHVRLIRDLLLAINYPGRRAQGDSPPAKLAPLRLSTSNASLSAAAAASAHEQQADSSLARVRALSGSAEEDGDRTPIARNAPPQPLKDEGRSLPAIAELLRSIPAAAPPTGPGGRRLMDVDV